METFQTIKNVRQTVDSLNACKEYVVNKQKKMEIERLVQELRLLEESLLVKNPMNFSVAASSPSTVVPLQQFRVLADTQKLTLNSIPALTEAAKERGLDPNVAVSSVIQMKENEKRIEAEALAAHMLPDIRSNLYGQNVSETELVQYVRRVVTGNLTVPPDSVEYVVMVIVQQLKREAGIV